MKRQNKSKEEGVPAIADTAVLEKVTTGELEYGGIAQSIM